MTFNKLKRNNEGFTIIEVLIVLAIAGLIMMVVFMAVPALQRNQRNTTRKSEAARVSALVAECLSNNNGNTGLCNNSGEIVSGVPTTGAEDPTTLAAAEFKEITQLYYTNDTNQTDASSILNGNVRNRAVFRFAAQCSTTASGNFVGGQARQYAVMYKTETGANTTYACING